jgi:hypothetical protein
VQYANALFVSIMEKFYIYKETKNNSQINDRQTVAIAKVLSEYIKKYIRSEWSTT